MFTSRSAGGGIFFASVCLAGWLLLGFSGRANAGMGPPAYTLTDLSVLDDHWIDRVYALNDIGQIVFGSRDNTFLYSGGSEQYIGDLGGYWTAGYGINNSGRIVGYANTADHSHDHAFLSSGGRMQDLGTLGGTFSWANAINQSGQVVGVSTPTGDPALVQHAFLYSGGAMHDLGTLGGLDSEAKAINDRGQVVGISGVAETQSPHAFLYRDGMMQDLGTLGGQYSYANGINNLGQIVGGADTADGQSHAFLYDGGIMQDLGTLGGTSSVAEAINESGEVIGTYSATGDSRAFLYESGTMYDLSSLIVDSPGSVFDGAIAINAGGEIIGYGTTSSGRFIEALLTPVATAVPLPPAAWASLTAFPILLLRKRLRRAIA